MRRLVFALLAATTTATVGCNLTINVPKRPTEPTDTSATTPASGPVDDRNTNYRPDQSGLRNVVRAKERTAQLVDFSGLQIFILDYELTNGKMPTIDEIKASLKSAADTQQIVKKIDEGVIILTGTKDKNAMWAYEVDADKIGGIVCTGPLGNVRRANVDEVKELLGKK